MVLRHRNVEGLHTGTLVGHAEPFEMPSHAPEPWTVDAACQPEKFPAGRLTADGPRVLLEPEDWFQRPHSLRTKAARAVCETCPVRQQCLEYAVRKRIPDGIWGGLTEKELRALLRKAYRQARARSYVVIRNRGQHAS